MFYYVKNLQGNYINLGAGAELGFYKRMGKTKHYIVDKHFTFKMSMKLYYKNNCIINYHPSQPQWWLTGFNPKHQNVNASKLRVKFVVHFNNHKNIFKSFYNTYIKKKTKSNDWKNWRFNTKKFRGYLSF